MIEFARFKIDPANQCVWRTGNGDDEQILLAPKAFSLLQYLVENRGRLVSHDELLDTLWPDVVVQPEVIKSQILAIRNALGADAHDARFIQTVRKRGYKFVGDVAATGAAPPWRSQRKLWIHPMWDAKLQWQNSKMRLASPKEPTGRSHLSSENLGLAKQP